jgi:hypothetical protein
VSSAPALMKLLSVVGTAAMFMVGGGIIEHGIAPLHHAVQAIGGGAIAGLLLDIAIGVVAGAIVLGAVSLFQRVVRKS